MRFLLSGIILFIFSCEDPLPYNEETPVVVEIDTAPPIIKWISPRFDAVVKEIVSIQCQVTDTSGIASTELYVDNLQSGISGIVASGSTYKFSWPTTEYEDRLEHQLAIYVADNADNDTISGSIRVIIDNTQSFPAPSNLISIDSLIIDSTFAGYKLTWYLSTDQYFAEYILQRSSDPVMTNSSEVFSTVDRSITEYEDDITNNEGLLYYRIKVEDIFGNQNPGDVISTSMSDMPLTWNIQSVQYTVNSLSISWGNPPFENYKFHNLLFSDKREGNYEILATYTDSLQSQYQSNAYTPYTENWFSINTGDSLGQISMSRPYMHPPPQDPVIDSVLYNDHTFTLHWNTEPHGDFSHYRILQTNDENPYHFAVLDSINNSEETTLEIMDIMESEYYLYQIITQDAWGLETRGPVITASSYYKFSTTIGEGINEVLYSVATTDDGKYFAAGESYNAGSWLVTIDESGEIEGSDNFGESNSGFRSITKASDGGYLLTGSTSTNENRDSLLVVKIDSFGDLEWSRNFGNDYNNGGNAIVHLTDGTFGITGFSHTNPENQDLFVLKIDSDGNQIWSQTFGENKSDEGHDILPLDNGGMVVLGETHSQGDDDGDIWILEIDADGNPIDTLLISNEGKQIGYSFVQNSLGGYVVGGITSSIHSGVTDALMIKVDDLGIVDWIFQYGGVSPDYGYAIIYSDNGWVMTGKTYSFNSYGQEDAWLLKVNDMGELEWMQIYGGTNDDSAFDIALALDSGFIICGSSYSNFNTDGWLIKTDSRGNYKGILSYP